MSNKTIVINPSLFNNEGLNKTRKKREKNTKPATVPLISPNILKNKLLKRIKEHKTKETEHLENNQKKLSSPQNNEWSVKTESMNNDKRYSDEFNESIHYLQTLSEEKKKKEEKEKYEKYKLKKKEELERKTLKHYSSMQHSENNPFVNIQLPEELQEWSIPRELIRENMGTNQSSIPLNLHKYNDYDVPYGILKGGLKPTYRDWRKTQKNFLQDSPSLSIHENTLHRPQNEREIRLNQLKEKIKKKEEEQYFEQIQDKLTNEHLIQKPKVENEISSFVLEPNIPSPSANMVVPSANMIVPSANMVVPSANTGNNTSNTFKRIIKKTIRKKYTLGKSKIKKSVGILLKDRGTRKQVLTAHRELKRKPINDIKSYLRDHNLIKIGSNAPNDVIRKLYESSMLSGEVTNNNTNIFLYNLSKSEKEL